MISKRITSQPVLILNKAFVVLLIFSSNILLAQRNIISNEMNRVGVNSFMSDTFHPFPFYNEREQWEGISPSLKNIYIKKANEYIGFDWPSMIASLFLEYSQTGNRSHYEQIAEKRREVLATLVVAECIEHKGRYMNDILNGVWATCEQTYWGYPAHLNMQKKKTGLPDISEPTVDLFAAETASLMAWTYYFLGHQLDSLSPAVGERIINEMDRRILTPNLTRTDFWWMGFGPGSVNNWNPWIVSNWLTSVLILEKDAKKKEAALKKIASCLDNFLNPYPEDGGCNEGPSYWGRAGGSLYDCLELLYQSSNKSFDIFKDPLVKNIGSYIYKVHIADEYYINFADASAKLNIEPAIVYGYGERTSNDTLMKLGADALKLQSGDNDDIGASIFRQLLTIFNLQKLEATHSTAETRPVYWLPQTQVLTARSKNNNKGLFLGAQGGHNNESHNHNDVGNFVVYYDGKPALVDVGVENYTSKTFSDKRYDIWTMQSAYHNCPTINGVMQSAGREFSAKDLRFSSSKNIVSLSMQLKDAYPPEAGIKNWKRTWIFDRDKSITLADDFSLSSSGGESFFTLMSAGTVEIQKDKIVISGNGFKLNIAYDKNQLSPEIEPISITDSRLKISWGDKLYRIKLHLNKAISTGKIKLVITGESNAA